MTRRLAAVGTALIVVGALVVLVLDVHTALGNSAHLRRTISEYGLGAQQWVFTAGVALLALGSTAVYLAAIRTRLAQVTSIASIAMTLWVAGLVAVIAVPKQDWSNDATLGLGGAIHRSGAAIAFVSIPIALLAVALPWRKDGRWGRRARVTITLTVLAIATLMPIAYALIVGMTTTTPWYRAVTLGYVQRILVVAEVVALLSLALWVRAAERREGSVSPRSRRSLAVRAGGPGHP